MWLRMIVFSLLISLMSYVDSDAKPRLQIIYPKIGEPVLSADSIFVLGNVKPPEAKVFINSFPIPVYPNGAFLAMLPFPKSGDLFDCRAISGTDTSQEKIRILVPGYLKTSSRDSLVIDTSFVHPRGLVNLNSGEVFRVAFKGTPGCQAAFNIQGLTTEIPMFEVPENRRYFWGNAALGGETPAKPRGVEGVYTGTYIIKSGDHAIDRRIRFVLKNTSSNYVDSFAPGRFSSDSSGTCSLVQRPLDLPEPISYYSSRGMYFIPSGARFRISGQFDNYSRVQFRREDQVWMRIDTLVYNPVKSRIIPGIIYSTTASKTSNRTLLTFRMGEQLPIKIEQFNDPARLLVTFFGVRTNYKNIYNVRSTPLLKSVEWISTADSVHQIQIELTDKQLWGYKPVFEKNLLILEIKNSPEIARWPLSPVKDKVITLDPGHNPDNGAVGPTNLVEKDVNLQVCHRIRRLLEEKGAMVVLTRDNQQGITLEARPKLAAFVDSDILLSVHFNSLPDGVNPYTNHGTSTHYFQPMSYNLAYLIHEKLLQELKLPDFGLFYRNLVMTRPTEMLSLLIEPAFIIHPEEEMLIRSEEFQEKIALAVVTALEEFYQAYR